MPDVFKLRDQSGGRVHLCNAHLDRKRNEIQLITESDLIYRFFMEGEWQLMPDELRFSVEWQPMPDELRFFVVMPDDPRLRRLQRNHPHRNFVELPVPFLASTLRQP